MEAKRKTEEPEDEVRRRGQREVDGSKGGGGENR